jgi:hypothetical protein
MPCPWTPRWSRNPLPNEPCWRPSARLS